MKNNDKLLRILDIVGFILSLITLCILMIVLVQSSTLFFLLFGVFFIYAMFQLVGFLESLSDSHKKHIIKNAAVKIRVDRV